MKKLVLLSLLCAVCLVSCGGRGTSDRRKTEAAGTSEQPIPVYRYKIVNTYPHDTEAYTQGLFWHDGALYESTGEYGTSTLRRVVLETGEVVRQTKLDDRFFAEGVVLLDGKIHQLTWLEQTAFVYDAATFVKTGEFTYGGEGWGLATDGKKLYMSDGTANLTVRNPYDFRTESTVVVRNAGSSVPYLNELEWIDGKIWANIYMSNQIVIINPANGRVEGIVDFTGITSQLEITPDTDVMNGIAHDSATGRIWVTGKNWNKLFEVEIVK